MFVHETHENPQSMCAALANSLDIGIRSVMLRILILRTLSSTRNGNGNSIHCYGTFITPSAIETDTFKEVE